MPARGTCTAAAVFAVNASVGANGGHCTVHPAMEGIDRFPASMNGSLN